MSWWQWILVGLGIWGVPGTLLTFAWYGVEDGLSAIVERTLFYSLFFWPIVMWFTWALTLSRRRRMTLDSF